MSADPVVIENLSIDENVTASRYCKPLRINYQQNGKDVSWDCVEVYDGVSVLVFNRDTDKFLIVKQFRPSVWSSKERERQRLNQAERQLNQAEEAGGVAGSGAGGRDAPVNPSEGFVLELCGGLVKKEGKNLREHAADELLEEVGYRIAPEKLVPMFCMAETVGITGNTLHCFYAEVGNSDRVSNGGGLDEENEKIDVVEIPSREVIACLSDATVTKSAELMLALLLIAQPKPIRDEVFAKAARAFAPSEDRPYVVVSPPAVAVAGREPSPPIGGLRRRRAPSESSNGSNEVVPVGHTTDQACIESFYAMLARNGLAVVPSRLTVGEAVVEPPASPPQLVPSPDGSTSGAVAVTIQPQAAEGFFRRLAGIFPFGGSAARPTAALAQQAPPTTSATAPSSGASSAGSSFVDLQAAAANMTNSSTPGGPSSGFSASASSSPGVRSLPNVDLGSTRSSSRGSSSMRGSGFMTKSLQQPIATAASSAAAGDAAVFEASRVSMMETARDGQEQGEQEGQEQEAPEGAIANFSSQPTVPSVEATLLARSTTTTTMAASSSLAAPPSSSSSRRRINVNLEAFPSKLRVPVLVASEGVNLLIRGFDSVTRAAKALPTALFYEEIEDEEETPYIGDASRRSNKKLVFSPEKTFLVGVGAVVLIGAGYLIGKKLAERNRQGGGGGGLFTCSKSTDSNGTTVLAKTGGRCCGSSKTKTVATTATTAAGGAAAIQDWTPTPAPVALPPSSSSSGVPSTAAAPAASPVSPPVAPAAPAVPAAPAAPAAVAPVISAVSSSTPDSAPSSSTSLLERLRDSAVVNATTTTPPTTATPSSSQQPSPPQLVKLEKPIEMSTDNVVSSSSSSSAGNNNVSSSSSGGFGFQKLRDRFKLGRDYFKGGDVGGRGGNQQEKK